MMEKIDYIVLGDYVLTMNHALETIRDGAVAVKDGKISEVGESKTLLKKYDAKTVIGGTDRAVLPGLINTHTHAAMVYFRGLADDLPLKDWLEGHIWPAEARWLSPQFVSDAVELACLEMLKAGVTTFCDMYFYTGSTAAASRKMGLRAVVGAGIVDFPTVSGKGADDYLANAEQFISEWKNDELITPCIAPHSTYACGPETLKKVRTVADRNGVMMQIHLSETEWEVNEIISKQGKRPVKYLEALGFLDGRVIASHCVRLDAGEIETLARMKVGVSHCLESNLKLASGIAPVPEMLKAGVKVSFGTDGAASNNDLSILSEMSTAAKVHKAVTGDPTAMNAKTVLLMATRSGAEVLGLGDKTGSLEKGKHADIITLDLRKPHLVPLYDIYSHLAYTATSADIESVLIGGRLLIDKKVALACNEEEIIKKARKWGDKIRL
jgi:5-methylthioadenosine/S-adenosylhomocysteine deaminase